MIIIELQKLFNLEDLVMEKSDADEKRVFEFIDRVNEMLDAAGMFLQRKDLPPETAKIRAAAQTGIEAVKKGGLRGIFAPA